MYDSEPKFEDRMAELDFIFSRKMSAFSRITHPSTTRQPANL